MPPDAVTLKPSPALPTQQLASDGSTHGRRLIELSCRAVENRLEMALDAPIMRGLSLALGALLSSCSGFDHGVFRKDGVRYSIAEPDSARWRRIQLSENDLAWVARDSGDILAVNATCKEHGDPSLEVLTTHLLFGFGDYELIDRRTESLDGREALRSKYRAKLDGVPIELELVVLKKNGCVHDFSFIAPLATTSASAQHHEAFDALVARFRQETSP